MRTTRCRFGARRRSAAPPLPSIESTDTASAPTEGLFVRRRRSCSYRNHWRSRCRMGEWSGIGRCGGLKAIWLVERHQLADHPVVIAVVAAHVVATERVFEHMKEASVAVRAGPVGNVAALRLLHQVRIGQQRTRDGHAVAQPLGDGPTGIRPGLEPARTQHRNCQLLRICAAAEVVPGLVELEVAVPRLSPAVR